MLGDREAALPPPPRTPRLLIALALALSVLAHLALLAVFFRNPTGDSEAGPVEVFFLGAPLAQRSTPALTLAERRLEAERQALARTLVQPTLVPDSAATEDPATAASAAAGEDNAPTDAGGLVTRPQVIASTRTLPTYTKEAEHAHLIGDLVLRAEIDEHGKVGHIEVVRGLPFGLNEAAMKAVRTWRFRPATREGVPVSVHYLLIIHFRPPPEKPPPAASAPPPPSGTG